MLEGQSIKTDFSTWRWYLYDRERNEARLLAPHAPAGSYALGNPTVRALKGPAGEPLLFISGDAFSQGAGAGEAGQFIALRLATTGLAPDPAPAIVPAPFPPAPVALAPARAPADTTPPAARLTGRAQKLAKTVLVRVGCRDEPCLATTTGSVRVPAVGRAQARSTKLAAVTKTMAAGTTLNVRLALPASARTSIRRALKAGRRVAVEVRARIADRARNTGTLTRPVGLRL